MRQNYFPCYWNYVSKPLSSIIQKHSSNFQAKFSVTCLVLVYCQLSILDINPTIHL